MTSRIFLFLFSLFLFACNSTKNKTVVKTTNNKTANQNSKNRKLIWSDEFDIDGLPNPNNWSYNVGDACDLPMGCGWGNNELQYYTDGEKKNARVKDGFLIIEAHKEKIGKREYSSARIVTKGKQDFKYGRFEIRAKVPGGLGTWGAIWMMPTTSVYGGWPRSGEIDIMEHVGFEKDTIYGTPHTQNFNGMKGTQKTGAIAILDSEETFHTYAVDWTDNKIDWYVDNQLYHTFEKVGISPHNWPFDQDFHFILNVAVGGNWGGKHGVDPDIWPKQMMVDYVRVYE